MTELLVVISIIGVLAAMLIPAVQSARESARLAQCQSNSKQFALAMIQSIDTFRVLPEKRFTLNGNRTIIKEALWFDKARAFLEIEELSNETLQSPSAGVLLCPSSARPTLHGPLTNGIHGPVVDGSWAETIDYVASAGVSSSFSPDEDLSPFHQRAGVVADLFQQQSRRRDGEFRAGTSNTLACWEISGAKNLRYTHGGGASIFSKDWEEAIQGLVLVSDPDESELVPVTNSSAAIRYTATNAGFMRGYIALLNGFGQPIRVAGMETTNLWHRAANVNNSFHGPFSRHLGTWTAGMLDGSVRLIDIETAPSVVMKLATVGID